MTCVVYINQVKQPSCRAVQQITHHLSITNRKKKGGGLASRKLSEWEAVKSMDHQQDKAVSEWKRTAARWTTPRSLSDCFVLAFLDEAPLPCILGGPIPEKPRHREAFWKWIGRLNRLFPDFLARASCDQR